MVDAELRVTCCEPYHIVSAHSASIIILGHRIEALAGMPLKMIVGTESDWETLTNAIAKSYLYQEVSEFETSFYNLEGHENQMNVAVHPGIRCDVGSSCHFVRLQLRPLFRGMTFCIT